MPEHEELYPKNLLRNLLPCDYSNDTGKQLVPMESVSMFIFEFNGNSDN